jgi:hypothetical protein
MARRSTPTTRKRIGATSAARTPTERSSIVHSSLYLPEPVYEALRKIAFEERLKIHDVVQEGIDLALRRRVCPAGQGLAYSFTTEDRGVVLRRYRTNACQSCAIKHRCTTGKERLISRCEHEAVLETVASGHATLATKRTLTLAWAGLTPAGSHQLAAGALTRSPHRRCTGVCRGW